MVHQLEPMGYHAINVLLHSIVCLLYHKMVFDLTSSLPRPALLSFVSALLFAIHPIHTEAVTGVVGRAELISSIFFILTILQYKKETRMSLACVPVFTSIAMLSKEQGITVLGVCFVYEVFLIQGLDSWLRPNSSHQSTSSSIKKSIERIVVLVLTGLALLYIRFQVMGSNLPVFTNFDNPASYESAPVKQLTWCYLIAVNFWLLLSPSELCCDWTMKTIPLLEELGDLRNLATLSTAVLLLSLGMAAVFGSRSRHRRHTLIMSLSLISIPFLPASNLFFPVGFVVAERVLYLPSMGFCLLVALGLERLLAVKPGFLKVVFVALVSSHGAKTVLRNYDWNSELSIFKSGIAVNPNNAKLWNNVGHAYEALEDFKSALHYFEKAADVQPDDIGAHINVGRTQNNLGNHDNAESAYLKAKSLMPQPKPGQPYTARIAPQHLSVFLNLGNLIAKDPNRLEEADTLYKRAISMRSDYIQAYINRGDVLIKMGRHQEASDVYAKALTFEPDNPDLHYNLGVVHIEMGKPLEALAHFDRALSIDPDHIQALTNSAVLMQETGRQELRPKAYERLHAVLRKSMSRKDQKVVGGLERIYFNLGMLGMDDGDMTNAELWFKKAVELKSGFRSALFNLALLLNEQKRPLEALPFLQDLLKWFPDHVKGLILLGDIYTNHVKDLKAAESCYSKIVSVDPGHVQGKHNLCVVMVEQGRLAEAHSCLLEVQTMAPEEAYIAKHLQIVESRIRMANSGDTTTTMPPTTTSPK